METAEGKIYQYNNNKKKTNSAKLKKGHAEHERNDGGRSGLVDYSHSRSPFKRKQRHVLKLKNRLDEAPTCMLILKDRMIKTNVKIWI